MAITLKSILGKISVEEFKQEYLGKKTLFIRNALPDPGPLGSAEHFEAILSRETSAWSWRPTTDRDKALITDLSNPYLGKIDPQPVSVQNAKILRDAGWYLNVENVHFGNKDLTAFVTSIENQLDTMSKEYFVEYFQGTNGKGGLKWHNDYADVFIVQLEGSKIWYVDSKPSDKKLSFIGLLDESKLWITSHARREEVLPFSENVNEIMTIEMEKGDFLYMPAFTLHRTKPTSTYSLSVSILRNWMNFLEMIDQTVKTVDPDFHHRVNELLSVPGKTEEVKAFVLDRLQSLRTLLAQQKSVFYRQLGSAVSQNRFLPRLDDQTSDAPMPVITKTSKFRRDLKARVKTLELTENKRKKIDFNLDGRTYCFEEAKWFPLVSTLMNEEAFSGKEILELCGLQKAQDWSELKVILQELLLLGMIHVEDSQEKMRLSA